MPEEECDCRKEEEDDDDEEGEVDEEDEEENEELAEDSSCWSRRAKAKEAASFPSCWSSFCWSCLANASEASSTDVVVRSMVSVEEFDVIFPSFVAVAVFGRLTCLRT